MSPKVFYNSNRSINAQVTSHQTPSCHGHNRRRFAQGNPVYATRYIAQRLGVSSSRPLLQTTQPAQSDKYEVSKSHKTTQE